MGYISDVNKSYKSPSTDSKGCITTVIVAHHVWGSDGKFVLSWAQNRSIPFDIIRNGSNIQMLPFLDGKIKSVDTLNFFQCPLATYASVRLPVPVWTWHWLVEVLF